MMLWPIGKVIQIVVVKFKEWCGLPSVHGAIDGTRFKRSKHVLYLTMISIIK
jgi:fumarate reductase subunit D